MAQTIERCCMQIVPILFLVVVVETSSLAQLSKTSVVVSDTVVLNPASVSTLVSSPSIKLPGAGRYNVKVEFNVAKNYDAQKKLLPLRIQLNTKSSGQKTWSLLLRFSNTGSIREQKLSVSKDTQWLITSWYPDKNMRGGIANCGATNCYKGVDEVGVGKTKGLVFKFETPYGPTLVTIMPV